MAFLRDENLATAVTEHDSPEPQLARLPHLCRLDLRDEFHLAAIVQNDNNQFLWVPKILSRDARYVFERPIFLPTMATSRRMNPESRNK
jgi:hypothetical protein